MGLRGFLRKFFMKNDEEEVGPETFPSMERPSRKGEKEDLGMPSVRDYESKEFEQRQFQGDPIPAPRREARRDDFSKPRDELFRSPEPSREFQRDFPRDFPRELPREPPRREEMEAMKVIISKLDIIESRLKIIEGKLEERRY